MLAFAILVFTTAVLVLWVAGWFLFLGPFKRLSVTRIQISYHSRPYGEIVFYGASNFTLWRAMEEDMLPYVVQNHGFGGSTDKDLIQYANKLLYPYMPTIVVFSSGSNDFVFGMTVEEVCANKDRMYAMIRKALPNATFVVMSMLPLPGRSKYWANSMKVNTYLRQYCETHENIVFVDATDLFLSTDGNFRPEYYRNDGIHLNREGQLIWSTLIRQVLESITD